MARSVPKKWRIGFVGLGQMGIVFTRNLLRDGFTVSGTDPVEAARKRFKRAGGIPLAAPREVAESSELLFLSLPNSKISLKAARGKNGFLAFSSGKAPKAVIDTTTADPEDARRLEKLCRAKGVDFLDGCVSGNSRNVADKKGLFLVGGSQKVYRKLAPLFGRMLSDHVYCGPTGMGATLKVVINYLACMERCAIAESLRVGIRAGVPGERLLDILQRSAVNSHQLRVRGPRMVRRRYSDPDSSLDILMKDMRLGLLLAKRAGAHTPLGRASLPIYKEAVRAGHGPLDSAVVCQVFEDKERTR